MPKDKGILDLDETPKGALTQEQIMINNAKRAFEEQERLRKLQAPKELEELEALGEDIPLEPVGMRKYPRKSPEFLEIYENLYGPYPEKEYYKLMNPESFEELRTRSKRVITKLSDRKNLAIPEKKLAKNQRALDWKRNNPELSKEVQRLSDAQPARKEKKKLRYENLSDEKYSEYRIADTARKQGLAKEKLTTLFPEWENVWKEKYPFLSEEAFRNMALNRASKNVPLDDPTKYLQNAYYKRKWKFPTDTIDSWLSKFKGFGGDNVLRLDEETSKIPGSMGKMLPFVGPAMLASRGEYGEAAFEGGLNLAKANPATFLLNEAFNAEKLGPKEEDTEEYYREYPWKRPKNKQGVLHSNEED